MTDDKVMAALVEARRFLQACERLRDTRMADRLYHHGAQTAAVRRASLDLTRSLAQLRKATN